MTNPPKKWGKTQTGVEESLTTHLKFNSKCIGKYSNIFPTLSRMDSTQFRNHKILKEQIGSLKDFTKSKILLLSPDYFDYLFWKNIFPDASITISNINTWNLYDNFNNSKLPKYLIPRKFVTEHSVFDLTIAQNVFMYIHSPLIAINNLMEVSNYILIQDLKYRKRSFLSDGFGTDGDVSRYTISRAGNQIQSPYTLHSFLHQYETIFQMEYKGEINEFHSEDDPPVHILFLAKNKLKNTHYQIHFLYSKYSIFKLIIKFKLKSIFNVLYKCFL